MSLGLRIKTMRKARGFTQQKLAEMVGVSRTYIQTLESNRRLPSMKLLQNLARALDVNLSDLVSDNQNKKLIRAQLEEYLDYRSEMEVWYKDIKLTRYELDLIKKLIETVLDYTQKSNINNSN
ncbi:helix-turn-helix transcriptional regulator [Thermovirga sp.]|uniref:helix-turn-helix domain-containing protein n=1 Tax=Thermovirga sp. TaxID=2699834 RepID=UPI0025F734C6|nr:helix-turn-helix transcriptional regulator [Thermovirga sp.]MBO8153944.1 helix-turn-helix transcriptional regulator [Thermovirga sp.]